MYGSALPKLKAGHMSKRQRLFIFGMVALLMAAVLFQSCGLKADPVPSDAIRIKPISDLDVQLKTDGILLRWSIPEAVSLMTKFRIFRSELETEGSDCPGCPREHVLIVELAVDDSRILREGGSRLIYKDLLVKPGRLYSYYIIGCNRTGSCSEASNRVETKIPKNTVP
jgi:hypothetical protein